MTSVTHHRPHRRRPHLHRSSDALFGAYWPDRAPARRVLVGAAALSGLLAGLIVPFRDPGLGTAFVLWVCGGTVLLASPHVREPFTAACGALGVLLVVPVLLLDAGWIVTLCVLAGIVVLLVGVTDGRTVPGFVLAGIAWPLASLRGLPWLGRTLAHRRRCTAAPRRWRGPLSGRCSAWSCSACCSPPPTRCWRHGRARSCRTRTSTTSSPAFFVRVVFTGVVLAAAYLSLNPPRTEPFADRRPARCGSATSGWCRCCSSTGCSSSSSWLRRPSSSAATTTSSARPG